MTLASLTDIHAAIESALNTLARNAVTNPNGQIKTVRGFAGELNSAEDLQQFVLHNSPAILFALEGERVADTGDFEAREVNRFAEVVIEATFIVISVVQDVRPNISTVVKGTSSVGTWHGASGVYRCMSLVTSVLNNLFIANTFREIPLQFFESEPYVVIPGVVLAYAQRFKVNYVAVDAVLPSQEESSPISIEADFNRIGGVESTDGTPPLPDPLNPLQNPRVETDFST